MISYNTQLLSNNQEDLNDLKQLLEYHKVAFNIASKEQFGQTKNSIVLLHAKAYFQIRTLYPNIPSQVVIRAEQECLSSYRTAKSNKHKLKKPIEKKNLSMRLDKRLYSKNKSDKYSINITTINKRKSFKFVVYARLKELMDKYTHQDPLIYENDGKLFISFCFNNKIENVKSKLALGVDLGMRVNAACSDGRIIVDRKFNGDIRKLRHLKDNLKSKGTKSARRHLLKLRHKEHNKNRNQTHLISNEILKTNADTIVLENLKGIKAKKHKFQNKRAISQVPLFELRRVITYKAENAGKSVILVNPSYTSQIDSLTGKRDGIRKGRRFYAKSGLIYDSDLNASRNIAYRSKLPISYGNILDGQALVNVPIVCKSSASREVLQSPMALAYGLLTA
jgi:IS605 OrfB family transposase